MCVLDEVASSVVLCASYSAHPCCTQAAAQASRALASRRSQWSMACPHPLAATLYTYTEWELLAMGFFG